MNRLARIGIGALVGALATLLVHPLTKRYALAAFFEVGESAQMARSTWLPRNLSVLPVPNDTLSAGLWMQVGAELLQRGKAIRAAERQQLIQVAEAAARGEPQNAYWKQMDAVFLWDANRRQEAKAAWIAASKAGHWDDYQSRRLDRVRSELADIDGGPMAWHYAAAYYQRSEGPAEAIEALGRAIIKRLRLNPLGELELRLATLRNGRLLREWSRSVRVGNHGANLVDFAAIPVGVPAPANPRDQILAEGVFIEKVRPLGEPVVTEVDGSFRSNEAWFALAQPLDVFETARAQSEISILLATLPGILFGLAIVGFLLWGLVLLFEGFPRLQATLTAPFAPAAGLVAGAAIYLQTRLVLVAIAIAMCFGFLAFEPPRTRKRMPDRMGLAFRWTISGLAILFGALLASFWMGVSAPAFATISNLHLPSDLFGGNITFLCLAALVLSLLLLAAPAWAMVERVPTQFATIFTLRQFAVRLAWGGLAAGVIAVPLAAYFDVQVQHTMNVLMSNEPVHYLLQ